MTTELEQVTLKMETQDLETGETDIRITVEGKSEIPFWNHDLAVRAAVELLENVDIKHYEGKEELYDRDVAKVEKVLNILKMIDEE